MITELSEMELTSLGYPRAAVGDPLRFDRVAMASKKPAKHRQSSSPTQRQLETLGIFISRSAAPEPLVRVVADKPFAETVGPVRREHPTLQPDLLESFAPARRDEWVVEIERVQELRPALMLFSDRSGLIAWRRHRQVFIAAFLGEPDPTRHLADLDPARAPLALWARTFADDPWLSRLITQHSADPTVRDIGWRDAALAGIVSRLYVPGREEARRRAQVLRSSGKPDWDDPATSWAAELPRVNLRQLDRTAGERAHGVSAKLERALETIEPDTPAWRERLSELLVSRDDLEGVLTLLEGQDQGLGRRARDVLSALDARMDVAVSALPPFAIPAAQEVRLRRAASADADAWWVQPWFLWADEQDASAPPG